MYSADLPAELHNIKQVFKLHYELNVKQTIGKSSKQKELDNYDDDQNFIQIYLTSEMQGSNSLEAILRNVRETFEKKVS